MFIKKYEAVNFINQLKHISIFCEDIILNNPIKKEQVNNKDVDGYHIIYDDENTQKYNIYLKKSTLVKGYVYNSVDINVKYVGFIEIISYKPNIKKIDINTPISTQLKPQIKDDKNKKCDKYIEKISTNIVKSVLANPCVMPTIFEDKEVNDEDITKKVNIEKTDLTNINKKQKLEKTKSISDKHLYVELNEQLIEELKKKLDRLSLKKNM
jgi:hypothetical protein